MTVRGFIERHPEATLDLMTPGGYVYLTPEQSKALLNDRSYTDSSMIKSVTAKDLLSQIICSANFFDDQWHMKTDYQQNMAEYYGKPLEQIMEKEIKLKERVKANYDTYIQQLQNKPAPELIEMATEIAATKFVYEELVVDGYFSDSIDYLLEFDSPLEFVRDVWLESQSRDHHEELDSIIYSKVEKAIRAGEYTNEPEGASPSLEKGVTLC